MHIPVSLFPPLFSRSPSCDWTSSSTVCGRSWYGRPDSYLVAKNESFSCFHFYFDPSASPVQAKKLLINYSVAFQRHHEIHSLGCTLQPKRPTVTDYYVSMPHADICCFWLQANLYNSMLLQISWMIASWWNNLGFTTSPLSLPMKAFNYHY